MFGFICKIYNRSVMKGNKYMYEYNICIKIAIVMTQTYFSPISL